MSIEYLSARPKPKDYVAGIPFEVAEHKLDGHRMSLFRGYDGEVHAFGRKTDIDLWPVLSANARLRELVLGGMNIKTMIDGELHVDGPATDVRSAIAEAPDLLDFTAFAIPLCDGKDATSWSIQEARTHLTSLGFSIPAVLLRDQALTEADITEWKAKSRSMHIEGLVLKQAHWSGWYKLKPTSTTDVVVYAVLPGCGKHAGRMGALMIEAHDEAGIARPLGKVGGGFTDVEREWPKEQWIGRVIEVEYDSLAARGRLRFPRFLRTRDDKPAAECRTPRT
jgi:ATP-dependent DNA ligase